MDLIDLRDGAAYIPKEVMEKSVMDYKRQAFEVF